MQNDSLVTVICLCYNHAEYVEEALNSVINQTYKNIELIIADDFSTDNSVQVIENWLKIHPEISFVKNKKNVGNTTTFNQCLKIAKGAYIIDLAADDILLPETIEKQLKGFANSTYENLGIVYGNLELVTNDKKHLRYFLPVDANYKRLNPERTGDIYIGLLDGTNNMGAVASMVKREVFDTLGGYDENLAYEDYDFWIRAARLYNFDYIDEILIVKRMLENSLETQAFKKWNKKTRKFNYSTYLILKKVFALNKNKEEFIAMLKRVHYEMTVAFATRDLLLLFKYIIFELKVRLKIKTL
ncbi:glycosyltransferase family 2 protein [Flavobacterium sp.]|jgi:glycosyltransferase involved in cell wall biosynthesis|uniref:glycosyltransferase family 2 protein n=1 Tax=Flavobacterium sp. TaxID=239 RepID=UPI0037BF2D1E